MEGGAAPAEDQTTREYRALHDAEVAELQRTRSLAQQAAAAGNTEMAKSYAEAAQAAYTRANEISLLSIKHNEPAADTGEIKNFEYAQTHPGFPVPGAAKLEFRDLGPDQYGRPQYGSFNPQTGEITPYKPAAAAGAMPAAMASDVETDTAPPGQPVAQLPPGQKAIVAQLDPAVQGHVTAILQGRETMPKIPAGGRVNPITAAPRHLPSRRTQTSPVPSIAYRRRGSRTRPRQFRPQASIERASCAP
jgi:hypothetical protein